MTELKEDFSMQAPDPEDSWAEPLTLKLETKTETEDETLLTPAAALPPALPSAPFLAILALRTALPAAGDLTPAACRHVKR